MRIIYYLLIFFCENAFFYSKLKKFNRLFSSYTPSKYRVMIQCTSPFWVMATSHLVAKKLSLHSKSFDLFKLYFVNQFFEKTNKKAAVERNGQTLFLCGMFPSIFHGGGLRVRDIFSFLNKKHPVNVICPYEKIAENEIEAIESIGIELNVCRERKDILSQANLFLSNHDSANVFFEWLQSSEWLAFVSAKHRKIYTFMECSTLSLYQDCQRILSAGNYEKHREYFKKLVSVFSFEEFAARNCDQMIAVNQPDAAFIEHLFDKNALVVPTGVSLDFVQESSTVRQVPENQFNVGFLGYYWHYPNVDGVLWYLNRIHPYVKDLVPNYQFKIYGRGPIEKYLGAFSRDPQIEVVGEVDSIPEAFEAVDVAVAPLINGAGIRGKVNQYVAMKKAVVGTPLSMAGLPYQNMRDVFVESSPYSFAERIVELLENSEKRKQLANSAFDQMERYVQCDSTLKPIQDLIERP